MNGFISKLKLTTLAILSMTASTMIFAGDEVSPPSTWTSIGIDALRLKPSFGGNGLGYSSFGNYSGNDDNGHFVGVDGATNHIHNINPRWHWGFNLHATYHFDPATDINFEWYHLNQAIDGHLPTGSVFSGNYDGFYAGPLKLQQHWDAVNLEVGQKIFIAPLSSTRLHGGLHATKIENRFTTYPMLFPTTDLLFVTRDKFTYRGIGPRLGVDFDFYNCYGIAFYAKFAGSLLVGSASQDNSGYQNYTNVTYGFQPYGTPNYSQSHHGIIVPELESKLGIKYVYPLTPTSLLAFDLGYLWMTYLNAINTYYNVGIVGTGTGASIGVHSSTHFDLNGFYLGIKWSL